jgi:hypothetical protein
MKFLDSLIKEGVGWKELLYVDYFYVPFATKSFTFGGISTWPVAFVARVRHEAVVIFYQSLLPGISSVMLNEKTREQVNPGVVQYIARSATHL